MLYFRGKITSPVVSPFLAFLPQLPYCSVTTSFLNMPHNKSCFRHSTLRILVTVGSALRMRPGFGWILAFSAVFSLGANSLSSALNKIAGGSGLGGIERLFKVNQKKSEEKNLLKLRQKLYRFSVRHDVFTSDRRPSLWHSCSNIPRQSQLWWRKKITRFLVLLRASNIKSFRMNRLCILLR